MDVEKPLVATLRMRASPTPKALKAKPNIDSTKPIKRKVVEELPQTRHQKTFAKKKKKLAEEEKEDMNVELNEEQVLAMLVERFPDLGRRTRHWIAAAVAEVYAAPVEEEVEEPVVEEAQEDEKEEMTETPEAVEEVVEETSEEINE